MQENKPFLVVGLGNPGTEYVRTRHNVGFLAVHYLAGADAAWKTEKDARTTTARIDGRRVIFAMPQTFMNLSGTAVLALMTYYKVPRENLVVIHDDMDIVPGKIREKIGGGSAGHNGIRSIDANVGNEYRRIRIGVGHPRDYDFAGTPADWVLGKIPDDQMVAIKTAISEIKLF